MDGHLLKLIGAGLAAIGCLGGGIGIGAAASGACQAIARQPEAQGKIMTFFILGAALAEATSIYALVVALMIFFTH
jgi:F-type H+-transporting ATPase subunit c